jgi:hypothetical protein
MKVRPLLIASLCACFVSGCASIGPHRLRADQVDYARALGDAKKREMLANIIGLRYADTPASLSVTQIIAAYTFDVTGGSTANLGSGSQASYALATGNVSYANHPTFTFTPTTGDAYAVEFIRPLPATLVLPLAESGIPIDLLLRLTAQSVAGLQNGTQLGGPNSDGSPRFFELLRALRRLQLAGELTFEYHETDHVGRVTMSIGGTPSGDTRQTDADVTQVRELLHLSPKQRQFEIVYGQSADRQGRTIPMVTRSVLGILSNLGAQIAVPAEDIRSGATTPTVRLIGGETRPTVIVHVGQAAPPDAYVSVPYGKAVYWVEATDFDSKYAFTVVQTLMALAQANQDTKAPIVTIPAS